MSIINKNNIKIYKTTEKKCMIIIDSVVEDINIALKFNTPVIKIKTYINKNKKQQLRNTQYENFFVNKNDKLKIKFYFLNGVNIFYIYVKSLANNNEINLNKQKIYNELLRKKLKKINFKNKNITNDFDYIFYINYYEDAMYLNIVDALDHYNKFIGVRIPNLQVFADLYNLNKITYRELNELKQNQQNIYELLKKKYVDFDYNFYVKLYRNDFLNLNLNTHELALKHYYFIGRHHGRIYNKSQINANYEKIYKLINYYIEEQKMLDTDNYNKFTILTRSNRRPTYFNRLYNSLFNQNYDVSLINLFVSCHNKITRNYLEKYKNIKIVDVIETKQQKNINNPYPYNIYLNDLIKHAVNDSWVIFIDDDDFFVNDYVLQTINYEIEKIKNKCKHNNFSLLWRVVRCDQLIGNICYGKKNLNLQILPLCGFAIHSSNLHLFKFDTHQVAKQTRKIQGSLDIYWSKFILTKIGQDDEIAGFSFCEI